MRSIQQMHWGGVALMLGALVFLPVKLRHLVDPDDSFLNIYLIAGFTLWLTGVIALNLRYRLRVGHVGKIGLLANILGIGLLAVGHLGEFLFARDLFVFVILGTLTLITGALLFGIATLRADVLPTWRFLPLVIGLIGLAWVFLTNSETSRPAFLLLRTLFGLGWLLLGYVLWRDRGSSTSPARHHTSTIDGDRAVFG